ncbi:uncharacterized protein N7529_009226, partial [Penicillium soppii]|uniref:uncharacterized protein n=1 Tax=Penicillium soppii TaxID=69789 RepID=UPI0025490CE7
PVYAPFVGSMGCVCAIVYTCFGAAYGTAQAGVGICSTAVLRPDLGCKEYVMSEHRKILRNGFAVKAVKDRCGSIDIVPVVMAGIIGIYGLVVFVLVANNLKQNLPLSTGLIQFCTGLSVGLAVLASGFAIGVIGGAGVRGAAQQPKLYVGMILILIFAEVLGKNEITYFVNTPNKS